MSLRKIMGVADVILQRPGASMRPEHVAPENGRQRTAIALYRVASMRPEHVAPENEHTRINRRKALRCFNEAGACRSGKCLSAQADKLDRAVASMRPEHVAPENMLPTCNNVSGYSRFNEAGACRSGK